MKSINFEFIRPHQPELATLGGFAERYSHGDPDGALVKLRNFAEEFVKDLYTKLGLPAPMHANLTAHFSYEDATEHEPKYLVPFEVFKATTQFQREGIRTGIDIPEIVNLIFAKPVKSYVKFWQMIGRGTRLCPNLFGLFKDKTEFFIFDHWRNFEFFEEQYKEANQAPVKSLLQRLFEARIELAETFFNAQDAASFDAAIEIIARDVADLPDDSLPVREKMREVLTARHDGALKTI